ncbi:elongator complex protein 5 [Ischnura elegans]|uniref:elongator complex protein 5 n=1 Tax=Ischnura elegans TaxID=197161 RepID=UPI001ED885A7|nr:elongator complex protein 5 [Ischnura elegans]
MTLSEVVTGKRKCRFLLISDTFENDGSSLLIGIIQSLIDRKCAVHVLCYENHVSHFKDLLRVTEDTNVKYHDLLTDHKGWLGLDKAGSQNEVNELFTSMRGDSTLVIDSLASMIINSSSAAVYKLIHRVVSSKEQGCRIVGLLHQDMLDEYEVMEMNHIAGIILRIQPPKPNSHGRNLCCIQLKNTKGNNRRVEHYSVDACNRLWSEPYTEAVKSTPADVVDPMADVTTFKLSLDEKEKEARSQLVLPYLRNDPKVETPGSGIIHYQPDEMDDWDEEDPDNDLNI